MSQEISQIKVKFKKVRATIKSKDLIIRQLYCPMKGFGQNIPSNKYLYN
ncbi:hypothetical protein AGMMS49574_28520 [Bacteroidia bacterium]|nr:hypothetical protein AGMMS49574_28520 [Bacteroidia bacterium]